MLQDIINNSNNTATANISTINNNKMAIGIQRRRNSPGWISRTSSNNSNQNALTLLVRNDPNMKKLRLSLPRVGYETVRVFVSFELEKNAVSSLEDLWLDGGNSAHHGRRRNSLGNNNNNNNNGDAFLPMDISLALARSLRSNKTLKVLRIRNAALSATAASAIFAALEENTTLQELHLERNQLGPVEALSLASMLEKNRALKILHINHNPIELEGCVAIANALSKNAMNTSSSLRELCLQDVGLTRLASDNNENKSTKSGVGQVLGEMLTKNTQLSTLQLVLSQLTSDDIVDLCQCVVSSSSTLEHLVVAGAASVNAKAGQAMASWMGHSSCALQTLSICGHPMSFQCDTAVALSNGLEQNRSLREVRFMMNGIGNKGATALAAAVAALPQLTTIDLTGNSIGRDGGNALVACMEQNVYITTLGLHGNQNEELACCKDRITQLVRMNKAGRRLYTQRRQDQKEASCLECIKTLTKNNDDPELSYYLLRSLPGLMKVRS